MSKTISKMIVLTMVLTMVLVIPTVAQKPAAPEELPELAPSAVDITILHTNDFHGNLETDYKGRGGSAYMATAIDDIRTDKGEENVVLLDAGDVFFGAPAISQLLLGESAINIYNMLEYDVAAFGNHEFDKGQTVLISRTVQSNFPWIGANIVVSGTDWTHPNWVKPWVTMTVGTTGNEAVLGIIGLDTDETPEVTLKGTTEGLVFKDMTETVLHYYDDVMAESDALIVLAHMGTEDSGPYKGLATVARELVDAGKPVELMIGGHQHQALFSPVVVSDTYILSAGYYGRYLGQVDISIDTATKDITYVTSTLHTINNTLAADPAVEAQVAYWAEQVKPYTEVPVATSYINLIRNYNDESNMGDLVTDSMLWKADQYDDGEVNGSVDIAFTNPGGLRADITMGTAYIPPTGTATLPYTITWGNTFEVLPFGNTLYYMDLTGAQIQALLDQAATLYKGILQTAGATWYWYNDTGDDQPNAWGAYGIMVNGEPLERDKVYRVVTNDFLAGGQDGWVTFADGTNRWNSYVNMQEALNEYLGQITPIENSDITGERIQRLDNVVTILHTNDTHGNWAAGTYYDDPNGMAYLASHIAAERTKNPDVVLLDAGDTFQGNAFAQYFRNDTPNPIAGGMNLLDYDAMVLGNHEFNFGPTTFATMLGQVNFPLLGTANLDDDGSYGFINDNVVDYITKTVDDLDVAIFGLTNNRVPRYELPTNIPGLTFYPVTPTAGSLVPQIIADEQPDLLVALTHIGYQPYAGEIDSDQILAQEVPGIDVIVGGHSHTRLDPAVIITSTVNPTGTLVGQAYKYARYLGKINIGYINDEIVLREGYLLDAAEVMTDTTLSDYLAPFLTELEEYTNEAIGQTTVPIDALEAYTQETNGANLQTDAAVWELAQNDVDVDFHLSGAMSNRIVPIGTVVYPYTLTIGDMYTLMPYENSLVAMRMNGPQLKRVLERAYEVYYCFKYEQDYCGFSHYTTCMLDIDSAGQITYHDAYPEPPNGDNVISLVFDGQSVDFLDATTYYTVSTVNYLAAGSCNYNDDGETLWPLDQIVADTQYYVRDSVIDYIKDQGVISPTIEGRLVFRSTRETRIYLPLVLNSYP